MLFLSYERPLSREKLPELAASFARLKARVRRRTLLSKLCGVLCFFLHTPMMILASVGLYYRLTGPAYQAALDALPHFSQVRQLCFETLPARLGLQMPYPELPGLAAAVLVPPLLCMVLALLLRLGFLLGKKPAADSADPQVLLAEAKELAGKARSRKANWIILSGVLIMLAFGAAVVYTLLVVNPASDEWDFKYILSYLFIALIAFSVFQLVATLTDMILELLCGLDYQWEGERLIGELEALIENETFPKTGVAEAAAGSQTDT